MVEVGGHLSGITYYLMGDKKKGGGSVVAGGDIAVGRDGSGVITGGAGIAGGGGCEVGSIASGSGATDGRWWR
jgi:hypothetical protein